MKLFEEAITHAVDTYFSASFTECKGVFLSSCINVFAFIYGKSKLDVALKLRSDIDARKPLEIVKRKAERKADRIAKSQAENETRRLANIARGGRSKT